MKVAGLGLPSSALVVADGFLVCFGLPLQTRNLGVFFAGIGKFGGVAQSDAFASCAGWLWDFLRRWCPRTTQAANSVLV